MSGRIYDLGIEPICLKCGSDMFTSHEQNFNGPRCKNKKCDGGIMDAKYKPFTESPKTKVECVDGKFILTGFFTYFR